MVLVKPTIDLCDAGHQAIAFIGTCPLCRKRPRDAEHPRPLEEGAGTFVSELEQVLRGRYK